MSLITTAVKFTVLPADGVPIAGLRVRCELTRPDVDGGVLVPQPRARGDTDASGQCTIPLWPNSRGVNASQYRVKVYQGTELIHSFLVTVPEQAGVVLAETIINQAPYPAVDAAQAAVTAAQAAAAEAANASRLVIGTVTTLDPGEEATASITGDVGEQVLNLGIPKGADGEGGPGGGAVTSVAGKTGDVTLTKTDVGLSNVDNTADANKPVSTAQAAADIAVLNAAAADATAKANAAQAASDPAGTASAAVAGHTAATDAHGDRAFASAADAAILSTARAYADSLVVGLVDDRGNYNASGNTFPASGGSGTAGAVLKGDLWTVSVAGTLGGVAVTPGDLVRALVDAPGQTAANWAITENNIGFTPENAANKDAAGGYAGLTGWKLNLKNALGTITSWFTTAATVARTWTMPDKDGTVALTSDIPGVGTTAGTVAAGDDPRLSDARTPTTHTHALSGLTQSGATTGQVPTWNGTAWAAATPSGGSSNTRWIGAGELIPRVTNGAGIDGEELATNKINLDYLAFDAGTAEYAQSTFDWPSGFTTFTAKAFWTAASGSGAVVWAAQARCYADDDALDQAQGTAQTVTDTLLAANDAHLSSATSAITPGGTVAAGNLCVVQVYRDATNGSDTLAVDARLIGVLLTFA